MLAASAQLEFEKAARLRDEAHRFAQHYHHLLRNKRSFEE